MYYPLTKYLYKEEKHPIHYLEYEVLFVLQNFLYNWSETISESCNMQQVHYV